MLQERRGNSFDGFHELPERQGQNLAVTVLHVPRSLDSGRRAVRYQLPFASGYEPSSMIAGETEGDRRQSRGQSPSPGRQKQTGDRVGHSRLGGQQLGRGSLHARVRYRANVEQPSQTMALA